MPVGVYVRHPKPPETRFWKYVEPEPNSGCWLWTGGRVGGRRGGYGTFTIEDDRPMLAHRFAYARIARRSIPDGTVLDHLCRVRSCVNPDHLETVSDRENFRRGEAPSAIAFRTGHCRRGHSYEMDGVYVHAGRRNCYPCRIESMRAWRRRNPDYVRPDKRQEVPA